MLTLYFFEICCKLKTFETIENQTKIKNMGRWYLRPLLEKSNLPSTWIYIFLLSLMSLTWLQVILGVYIFMLCRKWVRLNLLLSNVQKNMDVVPSTDVSLYFYSSSLTSSTFREVLVRISFKGIVKTKQQNNKSWHMMWCI